MQETNDFFRLDQEQWYCEFVEQLPTQNLPSTTTHSEFFALDVPF